MGYERAEAPPERSRPWSRPTAVRPRAQRSASSDRDQGAGVGPQCQRR